MNDDEPIPAWDGRDIAALLELEPIRALGFRNRAGDANAHGRAYGGQVLGQALLAAARTVEPGRAFTMLQFLFLQGTQHDRPIDFAVAALQDGKRFSSRHVRGTQAGGRIVFDAQVSFALPLAAPCHAAAPSPSFADEDPQAQPRVGDLPASWGDDLERAVGYRFWLKEAIDFRFAAPVDGLRLDRREPRLRFWMRLAHRLGDDAHLHSAAFAYLSDWWLNYPALGAHVQSLLDDGRRLYVASLNHSIWQHQALRADEWLHFESVSPAAADGRGLSVARVHDRAGRLVASATQECLMAPRDG